MTFSHILTLPSMPLCIGANTEPNNPKPLPNVLPFELYLDEKNVRLQQGRSSALDEILQIAYQFGFEMGTPSADTELGKPYVLDFLDFITKVAPERGRALEIGAGVGYLSTLLAENQWNVDAIEPGKGYEAQWEKYNIRVINEFFPSAKAKGPYDLIVFYTVLEHVFDTGSFLQEVIRHLSPEGTIVIGVPDCTAEIQYGDPSMLLHEHFQYFTSESLIRTLQNAGLDAMVEPSSYGRSLYACARPSNIHRANEASTEEFQMLQEYPHKVTQLATAIDDRLRDSSSAAVGVYCPARALALLPQQAKFRFFDDSPELHGKYYPPFQAHIESRTELLQNPPDLLWIASRTFGERIRSALHESLPKTEIILTSDILSEKSDSLHHTHGN
jgi:SAM-dependent methyltransferase